MTEVTTRRGREWRFVTQNTVYYVRNGICVRIEPLEVGSAEAQQAVGAPLLGGYHPRDGKMIQLPAEIPRGARLVFDIGTSVLRTSPIHLAEAVREP